jgi:hypothetical protein
VLIRPAVALLLLALLLPAEGTAQSVRYFGVWSYTENAPSGEIDPAQLAKRTLGYWEIEFDAAGKTVSGTYHAAAGEAWLTFRYVEVEDRIYADLYAPDGRLVNRKGTALTTRLPN